MPLDKMIEEQQAIEEIGEAMQLPAFSRIADLLSEYEARILAAGIDDESMSKDFLRGAVHCARTLRTSLLQAKSKMDMDRQREAAMVAAKREAQRHFNPPGSGPGGMS